LRKERGHLLTLRREKGPFALQLGETDTRRPSKAKKIVLVAKSDAGVGEERVLLKKGRGEDQLHWTTEELAMQKIQNSGVPRKKENASRKSHYFSVPRKKGPKQLIKRKRKGCTTATREKGSYESARDMRERE